MRQKLLQKAGLLSLVLLASGVFLSGCIDEPNPPVLDRVTSEVRFVHAIPDGPAMDIWVDGEAVVTNVNYMGYSGYLTVNSGNRFLRVVPAGADSSAAIFRQLVSVRSLTKMTIAFANSKDDVSLLITQERFTYADETSMLTDSTDLKLINLSNTGVPYKLQRKVSDQDYEDMIAAIDKNVLTPYLRFSAEQNGFAGFAIATGGNSRVVEFDHTFQKPGYRYTFIIVGPDSQSNLGAIRLQDEPMP